MMKFLIIDTYYPAFLKTFYEQHPELAERSYHEQWQVLMEQCFGTADFYSSNLRKLGHEATEIVANCQPLQMRWAKEHGVKLQSKLQWHSYRKIPIPRWVKQDWVYPILLAQVKTYQPDVVYFQDPGNTEPSFLLQIRPFVRLIVGQIASQIHSHSHFKEYNLMLSSLPHYVQNFQKQGLQSHLFRLGFEQSLLKRLNPLSEKYQVVHIGGYGPIHQERNVLLEDILNRGISLRCWGYGIDKLSSNSPIHRCYQGEAWGLEMYNIRHNSRIVVSKHISSVASTHANIMTLYEATGVGSLLVIDHQQDLDKLFEPGKEVVAYHSPEECVNMIQYYLEHEDERKAIALAGQQRTLREHTYYHRMQELVEIIKVLF